jgi:uncharacterized membrane-anchored protein YitT (DUF2179 family)
MSTERKKFFVVNEFIVLTVACFIFALAWEGFMIPNGMSAGGMMGLCTVIQYATGGLIPAQYSYFAVNAILIIVAIIAMGIGFGFKTIYCIVMSSLAMQIVASIPGIHSVAGEFFLYARPCSYPSSPACSRPSASAWSCATGRARAAPTSSL